MTAWEQVLDELVRARGRALVRYATLLTGDEREGEDLVQDALVRCFSQGRPLRDPGAAEAYVRQAVLSIFLDGYRRRARWTAVRHLLARDDDTADHEPASTARLDVQSALLTLRPRLRACVVLRFYDDLTVPEIARRLVDLGRHRQALPLRRDRPARVPAGAAARRAHPRHPADPDRSTPMSPDLTRALHDAVDTGPDDSPFDVTSLTGRIRRRRTVRAGVRGGVAVGAAGAVALGAVYVGGRDPYSVLPAARADADPGTCGSDIGLLPMAEPGRVGLLPSGGRHAWYMERARHRPAAGHRPGAPARAHHEPDPRPRAVAGGSGRRGRRRWCSSANESLADAEARRASTLADPPGAVPLTAGQLAALDRGVEAARQQLEHARERRPRSPASATSSHSQVLITHDGTVVATDADPSPGAQYTWIVVARPRPWS